MLKKNIVVSNKIITLLILLFMTSMLTGYSLPTRAADLQEAQKAVVKLFITSQSWDMRQPWTKLGPIKGVCSGFYIPQGILTNAHCVTDATYIRVELPGKAEKVEARIKAVNHQVDLALIELADPSDNPDVKAITFDALPELREKVVTVGYPTGGRQVSYTEGVVSRIDIMAYAHSNIGSLMVQTDAAINPGNSGGPVFSDRTGDSLGVATQRVRSGQSIGYFIPAPVINQFLDDLKDGHVDGIPALGAFMQPMENPAFRESMQMKEEQTGTRVMIVAQDSSADGVIMEDDVMLTIEGQQIFNDGRVPFRGDGKIDMGYYVTTHQVGDKLSLQVLRDGKIKDIQVRLKPFKVRVIPTMPEFDTPPRYFEKGGIIFRAVERRYIASLGKALPVSLREYLGTVYGEIEGLNELVVISYVFDATVNKGYSTLVENVRIKSINGREIHGLEDVVKAFDTAKKRRYHVIELESRVRIVLDADKVEIEDEDIRKRYDIEQD